MDRTRYEIHRHLPNDIVKQSSESENAPYWSERRSKNVARDIRSLREASSKILGARNPLTLSADLTKLSSAMAKLTVHLISDNPKDDKILDEMDYYLNPARALLEIGGEAAGRIYPDILRQIDIIANEMRVVTDPKSSPGEKQNAIEKIKEAERNVRDFYDHRHEFDRIGSPRDYDKAGKSSPRGDFPERNHDRVNDRSPPGDLGGHDGGRADV